jgi:large subunit ribosomal protein L17
MRHRYKKAKFGHGHDANKMLMRKMVINFINRGKINTTLAKAKALKPIVETLVEKAKEVNEANKNFLLRKIGRKETVEVMFKEVGPAVKDIIGGYVRVVKMGRRESDGAEAARLEWAYPVVLEDKAKKELTTAKEKEKTKTK